MQRVILKNDPQRGGWATDQREERGGRMCRKVGMDSGREEWIPEDELTFGDNVESPLDALRAGKAFKPSNLRRALLHIRLFGRLEDMIYSMEATNTDFYPHQFKPVLKLLRSPSQGILIADEVGLGKTIEAGLIWTELRARYDLRRLVVFCPAVLREKWRDELELKIGLRPRICQNAREILDILQNPEHCEHGFALICSQQGLRPPRKWENEENPKNPRTRLAQFLLEAQNDPPIDLLVIDEAQHIRNSKSKTYDMGYLLRKASQYAVFLSATPLANRNEDLFMLLNLLDEGTFTYKHDFENVLDANEPIVKLRDKILKDEITVEDFRSEISRARENLLLQTNNQLIRLEEEPLTDNELAQRETRARLAERLEHVHLLGHVMTRTRKQDIDIRATREVTDQPIPMNSTEQDVYEFITREILEAAKQRVGPAIFFLMTPQRQMTSSMISALEHWRARKEDWEIGEWDDEYEDDEDGKNIAASLSVAAEVYHRNREYLEGLESQLRTKDSKYKRLSEKLDEYFSQYSTGKVIIFSAFPGTLEYLHKRLKCDYPKWGSIVLRGGGTAEDKMSIVGDFRNNENMRILLSSEVGGEGIDLQFCWVVINYDIPWNPMRLEQRIGRVDRIGQKSDKIVIWNLLHKNTIDERIYEAVGTKRWLEERSLGNAEAVIAKEFRELTRDLLLGGLSLEQQEQRLDNAKMAVARSARITAQLEEEAAHLIAHGDYLLQQIQDARDKNRWITPDDLAAYIGDFLIAKCAGSTFHRLDDEHNYEITLSGDSIFRFQRFIKQQKISYAGRLLINDRPAKICFDNHHISHEKMETITHVHPLIKFAAYETEHGNEILRPTIAAKLSHSKIPDADVGVYLVVGNLWKFESGTMRIEKIACACKHLKSENLFSGEKAEAVAIAAAKEGTYWPQWQNLIDKESAYESAQSAIECLDHLYRAFCEDLTATARDRAEIQLSSVRRQSEREKDSINRAIATLRQKGQDRMIRLQESRLKMVQKRLQDRTDAIEANMKDINSHPTEIFSAVVLVE